MQCNLDEQSIVVMRGSTGARGGKRQVVDSRAKEWLSRCGKVEGFGGGSSETTTPRCGFGASKHYCGDGVGAFVVGLED